MSTPQLSVNEALSGITGSISLACWVFVLVPQIWENYTAKSAAGLSLAFLLIWFVGDVTNFAGAVLAKLVPTVIAVAIWFLFIDAALIVQVLYYNYINNRKTGAAPPNAADRDGATPAGPNENDPLLRQNSTDVPGSRRRSSSLRQAGRDELPALQELREGKAHRRVFKNLAAVVALFVVGTCAWAFAYATGAWKPTPTERNGEKTDDVLAVVLGYTSAVLYLGARIPQIVKNFREKSCEGLSSLFFVLSLAGNLTYGAQIFFHSLERDYLLTNLPWLLGSLGTIGEDLTILVQFRMYKKNAAVE